MDCMIKAAYYWDFQKARVEWIAAQHDVEFEADMNFLYDLFDCGDLELTDEEIWDAIKEEE